MAWYVNGTKHVCLGTWLKPCCERKQIRPEWLISVTGWFGLILHGKARNVPLNRKCAKLSLNTSEFWETSEHCIYAAGNHSASAVESKPFAQYVTQKFVGKDRGSGRNVTADNWFKPLVKSLRENSDLTHVELVRTN